MRYNNVVLSGIRAMVVEGGLLLLVGRPLLQSGEDGFSGSEPVGQKVSLQVCSVTN